MKNTKIPIIKGHWCMLKVILLSLLYPCLGYSCSDSASSAIPDDWITISTESVSFPYEGGTEKREFALGQGLDINQIASTLSNKGEDWLTALVENGKMTIVCERSFAERVRSSVLTLMYDDNHKCNITISQEAAPSSADKLIKVIGGEATSEETQGKDTDQNPLTLKMSYDGNKKTYFNSAFGQVSYPFSIRYELEKGHTLNSIVYTPRTDSGNKWGSFDQFTVEVSTADKPDDFVKIGDYARGNGVHTPFTIKLSSPVEDAKFVRFTITKAYEDRVSCAEMEFYEASSNKFDPATIFADNMGLQLKAGVTEKQIKQIPNEYLKELGLALLSGNYESAYRLADYRPYQNPAVMATANKTSKYSLRDNPTGIYAKAGETLAIFVDDIYEGGRISMLIQDLNGGYNNSKTYELSEGYNEITVEVGGLIYILNHVNDDIPLRLEDADNDQKRNIEAKTVKVHFANGKVNGYFDIQKNKESDWAQIRDNAKYQEIDILGEYSHLTWRISDFKKYNTEITKTIENLDRLVYLEEEFMGLVKYGKMFNNRMHFSIDYKAKSPNASDYRTVYNASDYYAEPFCKPENFPTRCWGPAHEVGHCNQTRPGLKWAGLTEVTNNIMSLFIQTSFGRPCKLLVDGCTLKDENDQTLGTYNNIYQGATSLIVDGKRPHCLPGIANITRETQLVPFWQLKLYMIDVLGKTDFYHKLYEYFRTHDSPSDKGENQGMNQLDFVRQVCDISGLNMLDFFEKWGFLYPVKTTLNDYGNKAFEITEEQIRLLKEEINGRGYEMPHPNVHQITEINLDDYK